METEPLLAHIDGIPDPTVPPVADISHVILALAGDTGPGGNAQWSGAQADKLLALAPATVTELIAERNPNRDPFLDIDVLHHRADDRLNAIWDAVYGPSEPWETPPSPVPHLDDATDDLRASWAAAMSVPQRWVTGYVPDEPFHPTGHTLEVTWSGAPPLPGDEITVSGLRGPFEDVSGRVTEVTCTGSEWTATLDTRPDPPGIRVTGQEAITAALRHLGAATHRRFLDGITNT